MCSLETERGMTHDSRVKLRIPVAVVVLSMVLFSGCGPGTPAGSSTSPQAPAPFSSGGTASSTAGKSPNTTADGIPIPGQAQPKLQTLKLWMGPKELITELALTPNQWAAGMMFRTNMADGEGMLFVFPQRTRAAFWMKNTYVPLSGAYIDPEGTILEIHDMKPLNETSIQAATDNIQYVLEVPQGWFARNGITTNMTIRTERGGLRETFFRGR